MDKKKEGWTRTDRYGIERERGKRLRKREA